jgi:hypothetical protein
VSAHTESSEPSESRISPSPCGRGLGEGASRLMERAFRLPPAANLLEPQRNRNTAHPRGRES